MDIFSLAAIAAIVIAVALAGLKRFGMTQLLILGCMAVFTLEIVAPRGTIIEELSFQPIFLTNGQSLYTVFTSMFVHADVFHIFGNMLFLLLVGVPLEDRVGKRKFAGIFFIAGVAAVLVESLVRWDTPTLILGASGAISGVMGAMLLLYPKDRIPMFVGPIFLPSVAVWIAVGSWFGLQVFYLAFYGTASGTAYGAHLGGFLAGMVLGQLLPAGEKREKIREVNLAPLEALATTPQLRNALDKAKGEQEREVRDAWLEYFAKHAKCPQCGSAYAFKGSKLKCQNGHEVNLK